MQIIRDVEKGVRDKSKVEIIENRAEAIRTAINLASRTPSESGEKSVVLILAKGAEEFIVGLHGTKIPHSDIEMAKKALQEHYARAT